MVTEGKKTFTSNARKIINKSSARKILTKANNEILNYFDLDGDYRIVQKPQPEDNLKK